MFSPSFLLFSMNGLLFIPILLLIIETVCIIYLWHNRIVQYSINQEKEKEEQDKLYEIQKEIYQLSQRRTLLLQEITSKKEEIDKIYEKEKNQISEQINLYKSNAEYASEQYISTLEQEYDNIEQKHDIKMQELNAEEEQYQTVLKDYESKIEDLKATLNAGARAQLREREIEEEQDFYKLSLTQTELDDIMKLENIKLSLHQPVVLSKLIWSTYFQKQTTEMCNRIFGTNTVCGIYKITDLKTKQYYIGQSVNVSNRIKEHIKCGLGIDAPTTNKLYNAMQKDGVWNFTFELLEECERSQLDTKEAFWIEMYQAYDYGLNSSHGNNR